MYAVGIGTAEKAKLVADHVGYSSDKLFAKADEFKVTTKQLLRFEELYKQRTN